MIMSYLFVLFIYFMKNILMFFFLLLFQTGLFIFSFFFILILFYFFFNNLSFSYEKKNFFYVFGRWKLFFFYKWFISKSMKDVYFLKKNKRLSCFYYSSFEFYEILKIKEFSSFRLFSRLDSNTLTSVLYPQYYVSYVSYKILISDYPLISTLNRRKKLKNFQLGFTSQFLKSERKNFFEALLNLIEVEKLRIINTYKDQQTFILIKKIIQFCEETKNESYQNLKTKIITAYDLDINNKKKGVSVDEQHLLDKVRNILVTGSNDNEVLVQHLVVTEYKVNNLERTVLDAYGKGLLNMNFKINLENIFNMHFIQKKILFLETIKFQDINILNLEKGVLISEPNKSIVQKQNEKKEKPLEFRKRIKRKDKSVILEIVKRLRIKKEKESKENTDKSKVAKSKNDSILGSADIKMSERSYKFFVKVLCKRINHSIILNKKINKRFFRSIKKVKRHSKKRFILITMFFKYNSSILDFKNTTFNSLPLMSSRSNSSDKMQAHMTLVFNSLFHNERISPVYPRKIFQKILNKITFEFLKWYWAEETMSPPPPTHEKFKKLMFPIKMNLYLGFPRTQSIVDEKPVSDRLPLRVVFRR